MHFFIQTAYAQSISLPDGFASGVASTSNNTIIGLSSYTELVIGVLLAVVVIGAIVAMLRHH
jgi:uncharacterized protein HemY